MPRRLLLVLAMLLSPLASAQAEPDEAETDEPVWIAQKAATDAFRFSVLATSTNGRGTAFALRVHDRRTGRIVQEFPNIDGMEVWRRANDMVQLVDANFDGHEDINLPVNDGGAGPNNSSNYYLYHPARARFALHPLLSSLTQVSINRDRSISAAGRGGCCMYEYAHYRYIGKRLTLISSETRQWIGEGKVKVASRRLVNGKMRYATRMAKTMDP